MNQSITFNYKSDNAALTRPMREKEKHERGKKIEKVMDIKKNEKKGIHYKISYK